VGAALFHEVRRTDKQRDRDMTKLRVAFHDVTSRVKMNGPVAQRQLHTHTHTYIYIYIYMTCTDGAVNVLRVQFA